MNIDWYAALKFRIKHMGHQWRPTSVYNYVLLDDEFDFPYNIFLSCPIKITSKKHTWNKVRQAEKNYTNETYEWMLDCLVFDAVSSAKDEKYEK